MNKKSIILLSLLIFISLAVFTSVNFAEDGDRSYSVPFANVHLYIQENGSLHVVETLHYSFSGTYHGVKRYIPLKTGEKIENLKVTSKGAYSTFQTSNDGQQENIIVYLYSNPEKTDPITSQNVDITYEYDFLNVINLYNDGATLQYTLWGSGWDFDLGKLNTYIHLNNKTGVKYWLNPSNLILNDKWEGNTISATSNQINSGDLLEVRMVIPKTYFNDPIYAFVKEGNGLTNFENIQKQYEWGINFFGMFYNILSIIFILIAIVPIFIYFKYGREPKILYNGIYEHEPPTDDSPGIVNALYKGNVGSVDMNAFKATILNLVNKKYIKMENFDDYSIDSKDEDANNPAMIFDDKLNKSDLEDSEERAYDILKLFADNQNRLDLNQFESDMKKEFHAKKFRDYFNAWSSDIEYEANTGIERFFISKGYNLARIVGFLGIILSGLTLFLIFFALIPFNMVESINNLFYTSIILLLSSIITILLPNHIFGHWTIEGREREEKWKNFKKYLNDFSLIKEHPPSSIAIWDKYLVYATALGVAKSVQKSMEKLIPKETLDSSDSYIFYNYGGTYLLFSSFDSGISTATSADSANVGGGGFGGGSGGGGGGAF
ncbi:DUF2207 domain-containing protein [Methanobrevibacter sp.]|uniref:DUF2207 domain-containing protein n=1 Tax=Methanobrevibacter sp. TaxID=66852 RepID=UPI0026347DF5|nr:DUF2207 domain-containing protein [uncultured Methanobrevibacter sp.]